MTAREKRAAAKKVIEKYNLLYRKRVGERCGEKYDRKATLMSELCALVGEIGYGEVVRRLERYFADNSVWLKREAWPLWVFVRQVGRYREDGGEIVTDRKKFDADYGLDKEEDDV
jgi:hypothetical protein